MSAANSNPFSGLRLVALSTNVWTTQEWNKRKILEIHDNFTSSWQQRCWITMLHAYQFFRFFLPSCLYLAYISKKVEAIDQKWATVLETGKIRELGVMLHFHCTVFSEYLEEDRIALSRGGVWRGICKSPYLEDEAYQLLIHGQLDCPVGILNWKSSHHSTLSCLCIGLPPKYITYYLFTYLLSTYLFV